MSHKRKLSIATSPNNINFNNLKIITIAIVLLKFVHFHPLTTSIPCLKPNKKDFIRLVMINVGRGSSAEENNIPIRSRNSSLLNNIVLRVGYSFV